MSIQPELGMTRRGSIKADLFNQVKPVEPNESKQGIGSKVWKEYKRQVELSRHDVHFVHAKRFVSMLEKNEKKYTVPKPSPIDNSSKKGTIVKGNNISMRDLVAKSTGSGQSNFLKEISIKNIGRQQVLVDEKVRDEIYQGAPHASVREIDGKKFLVMKDLDDMEASVLDSDQVIRVPGRIYVTWLNFLMHYLTLPQKLLHIMMEDRFMESIDDRYHDVIVFFLKFAFLVGLIGLIWYNYLVNSKSHFISLDSADSGICVEVPKFITGRYDMDVNGHWTGDELFSPTQALYRFDINSFAHNSNEFTAIIDWIRAEVAEVAAGAKYRTLTDNLLYWMTWESLYHDGEVAHRLSLRGDTRAIFDCWAFRSYISDYKEECHVDAHTTYDHADGTIHLEYSAKEFMSDAACVHLVKPENLGYYAPMNSDHFEFKIDVRTAMTAVAINQNIHSLGYLMRVYMPHEEDLHYEGVEYRVKAMIDARYEGMAPLLCYDPPANAPPHALEEFCGMRIGDVFVYPFLTQAGTEGLHGSSRFKLAPCTCDSELHEHKCDEFNFITGFIFFQNISTGYNLSHDEQFKHIMRMRQHELKLNTNLNHEVYDAARTSIILSGSKHYDNSTFTGTEQEDYDWMVSAHHREKAYDFCEGLCTLVTVEFYDPFNQHINNEFLELGAGSCSDTFSIKNTSWDRFRNPRHFPTEPIEPYYDCMMYTHDVILASLGIAFGIVEVLMLVLYIGFLVCFHRRDHMTVFEDPFALVPVPDHSEAMTASNKSTLSEEGSERSMKITREKSYLNDTVLEDFNDEQSAKSKEGNFDRT